MKTQSAKAKGRRLQQLLCEKLLALFPTLTPEDVRSTPMGQAGDDVQLSAAGKVAIPYAFECKNQEKVSVWAAIEQAERRKKDGALPVIVIKKNNSLPHAVLPLDAFLSFIAPAPPPPPPSSSRAEGAVLLLLEEAESILRSARLALDPPSAFV